MPVMSHDEQGLYQLELRRIYVNSFVMHNMFHGFCFTSLRDRFVNAPTYCNTKDHSVRMRIPYAQTNVLATYWILLN